MSADAISLSTNWLSLGNGPLLVCVLSGTAVLLPSDSQPAISTTAGTVVASSIGGTSTSVSDTGEIWAKGLTASTQIRVQALAPAAAQPSGNSSSAAVITFSELQLLSRILQALGAPAQDASIAAVIAALAAPLSLGLNGAPVSESNRLPVVINGNNISLALPDGAATDAAVKAVAAALAGTLEVATPTPATVVTGQVKIATTGVAVQLPKIALVNGLVVKAKATNAAQTASASATVGPAGVTTAYDGGGNGYPLAPGEAASFACANAGAIWLNGTAGDVFSYEGN